MYFSSDADEILEAVDSPEHVGIDDANRSLLEAQPQGILVPDGGACATTTRIDVHHDGRVKTNHHEEAAVITFAAVTLRDQVIVSPDRSGVVIPTRSGRTTSVTTRLGRGAAVTARRGRGKGVTSRGRGTRNGVNTVQAWGAGNGVITSRGRGAGNGVTNGRARGANKGVTFSQACGAGVTTHRGHGIDVAALRDTVTNGNAINVDVHTEVLPFASSVDDFCGQTATDATPVLRGQGLTVPNYSEEVLVTTTPVRCGQAFGDPAGRNQVGTTIEVNHSERVEAIAGHTHRSRAIMATAACCRQATFAAPLNLSKNIVTDDASIRRARVAAASAHTTRLAAIVNTSHPEGLTTTISTSVPISAR